MDLSDFKPRAEKRDNVVEDIISLREMGGTYQEIADFLNKKKVKTFSGRGAWYSQTIHRIYKKAIK